MSGNPMLVHTPFGLVPAPFPTEWIAAERKGVEVSVSGLAGSEWRQKGSVFLSNFRMVFVSERPDTKTGLHAVELPLVYLMHVSFNQPIFGCNNMTGECKILLSNGDEASPMRWKLSFMTGGAGTFLSLFNNYVQDPTRIFLTEQPVAESQRLKEAPKFVMPHLL
ncbi:hypothetical protein H632_c1614p0 [Helicosporidium sp. ATCC 50920]|nr:hypothetical protein H632_c1614p0 [Helicosporidium sp. ATCC 50920]|eukprot:KDD74055.1 hypothetical protein H632_c1614p0 [Helicosporidium sp. ATCC 50920]